MIEWAAAYGWVITVPVAAFAFCYACAIGGTVFGHWINEGR